VISLNPSHRDCFAGRFLFFVVLFFWEVFFFFLSTFFESYFAAPSASLHECVHLAVCDQIRVVRLWRLSLLLLRR